MKRTLIIIILPILIISCNTPKRINKNTIHKIEAITPKSNELSNYYLTIKIESLKSMNSIAETKKLNSKLIPALLFWKWEKNIKCDINPKIPVQLLYKNLTQNPENKELKTKLNGMHLELAIDSIPSGFLYVNKGFSIIFIIGFITNELETIYPSSSNLSFRYKIMNNGTVVKEGSLTIENTDIPLSNQANSTRYLTYSYLEQYKNNIEKLSKTLTTMIIREL